MIDTPIAEAGFAGLGVGAAMAGLRPIIEFMTFSFSLVAFDQIVNNAPNMLTMSGGQFHVPDGFPRAERAGASVGCNPLPRDRMRWYANVPGLKIVMPATPRDAKGLLKTAIRDDNPVLVLESEMLYSTKGEVDDLGPDLLVPFGKAAIHRPGTDVTILCYAQTVRMALAAAETLAGQGINAEVLDLRSIKPLDLDTILNSVARTHRVVVAEQDRPFCGIGSELCFQIQKHIFDELDAPILRVAQEEVPMPYNEALEAAVLPSAAKIVSAVREICPA